jgi:hypothetical protein
VEICYFPNVYQTLSLHWGIWRICALQISVGQAGSGFSKERMVFTVDGMALWDGVTTQTFDTISLKARFGSAPPSVALETVALSVSAAPLQMATTPKTVT